MMNRAVRIAGLPVLVAALLAGPVFSGKTKLASGEEAEVSFDGLHRVDKSVMDEAYVKPDINLSGYHRIFIDPVEVSYKRKPMQYQGRRASTGTGNFALTDRQMEELKDIFHESFVQAMSDGETWEVVESAGPDVLRVQAELVDLVVKVPTRRSTGREDYFVSELGEVTLVLALRDSQAGEILARGVDRQIIGRAAAGRVYRATSVSARSDVRSLFDAWARLLRLRLDQIKELTSDPSG